jgi:hypothetical protein
MKLEPRRLATRALLIWLGWTLYALFVSSQSYLSRAYNSRIELGPAVKYAFLDAYTWALLTPLVFLVAGKLVVRRANWWWAIPALVAIAVAFAVAHLNVFVRGLPWIGYRVSARTMQAMFTARFHADFLTCGVLIGVRHAIEYYQRYRIRELKASQLEARLAQAQLEVLKMQLQPHFLFNTLHAISALMYRDVESADRMVTRLSDFLRLAIDSSGVQEVTVKREMEFLDKYLEIEQVRFGERLDVRRSIDAAALDLLVPNLVLQPLVENAVRHGIAPRATGGRIEISARVANDVLTVEVQDDGSGPARELHEGVGLSNTRARLVQLYGAAARLELGAGPQGGFLARLSIPARPASGVSNHANSDR